MSHSNGKVRRRDPNKNSEGKRYGYDKGQKNIKKDVIVDQESQEVYEEKHWEKISKLKPSLIGKVKKGEAPATRMTKAKVCDGVLHISGTFIEAHKTEILNTIKNSAKLAEDNDAMNKIEKIEEKSGEITVYTLKNQLAVRIGKRLDKSFKGGRLDIAWSKEDMPVEVKWHIDLD